MAGRRLKPAAHRRSCAGAHGSNRTGRVFTEMQRRMLYEALTGMGAKQPRTGPGMAWRGPIEYITAAAGVRRPRNGRQRGTGRCRPYLRRTGFLPRFESCWRSANRGDSSPSPVGGRFSSPSDPTSVKGGSGLFPMERLGRSSIPPAKNQHGGSPARRETRLRANQDDCAFRPPPTRLHGLPSRNHGLGPPPARCDRHLLDRKEDDTER